MNKSFLVSIVMALCACAAPAPETPTPASSPQQEVPAASYQTPEPALITPAARSGLSTPEKQPATSPSITGNEPVQNFSLPEPSSFTWSQVASGLEQPLFITASGDDSGRMFILEQAGRIRVMENLTLVEKPFLDITERVGNNGSEQGLLGLAFHPRFESNGLFFINYTDSSGDTVIARFSTLDETLESGDPFSEEILFKIGQPYANHNGGMLAFGPDGYLYIATGDGGSANDPGDNAQSTTNLLGKILRIDIDRENGYKIPPDNPFTSTDASPEIWVYGLRNPWRFDFDSHTGDLYIGDVGQNQWEEIDYLPAGSSGGDNFGWSIFEGSQLTGLRMRTGSLYISPVAEYDHSLGCSVTGGVVYRGSSLPAWDGVYLYGDYCTGRIWGLNRDQNGTWQNAELFNGLGLISSFGKDDSGEVYLVIHSGDIYQLTSR